MTIYDPEIHHRKSIRYKGFDYSKAGYYFVTICAQDMAIRFGQIKDGKMILNPAGMMIERVWKEIPVFYADIEIDLYQVMPNHIHGIIIIKGQEKQGLQQDIENGKSVEEAGQWEAGQWEAGQWDAGQRKAGQREAGQGDAGQTQGSAPTEEHDFDKSPRVGINPCVYPFEPNPVNHRNSSQNTNSYPQTPIVPISSDDFDTPNIKKLLSLPDIVQRFKSFSTNEYIHGVKTKGWDRFNQKLWQRNYYEHIIRNPQELYDIQTYIINNPLQWELDKNNPNFEINQDEYYKDKIPSNDKIHSKDKIHSNDDEPLPKWMV